MGNTFAITRVQIVYALCLPLAVLIGYFLADPLNVSAIALIGLVLGVLAIPLFMKWYHPLLILTWNAAIQPYFLPGQFYLWTIFAFLGFGFAILNRFTTLDARFVHVPSLSRPLIFLGGVILATSWLRGGFGFQGLGSSTYGGKTYVFLVAAILGYFALASQRVSSKCANLLACLFFLSGITSIIPNLAWFSGGSADFLFYLFPPAFAMEQARGDYAVNAGIVRIGGLTASSVALLAALLTKHGIRDLFDWMRPWRFALLITALAGSLFCGFRNVFILCVLIIGVQFYLEGLFRGRILVFTIAAFVALACIIVPYADKLPMVAQRTLSFLPINVSPAAKYAGEASTDWRLQIWKEALPEIPKYFFLGKGHVIDPSELAFSTENENRGYVSFSEQALVVGNYHNGPLSVVIPYGIWGAIGFVWFLGSSLRFLYMSYRYGEPALRRINTFLFAMFIARTVLFFFVFGSFSQELYYFTGIIGLSVSLNGSNVRKPETATSMETEELAFNEHFAEELQPSLTPSLTEPS